MTQLYLYVADDISSVRRIDLATREVSRFTSGFASSIWGDGTYLYVTGSNSVRRIRIATREVTTFAGIANPSALWGDAPNLDVVDAGNIRKIALAAGEVTTVWKVFEGDADPPLLAMWGNGGQLFPGWVRGGYDYGSTIKQGSDMENTSTGVCPTSATGC